MFPFCQSQTLPQSIFCLHKHKMLDLVHKSYDSNLMLSTAPVSHSLFPIRILAESKIFDAVRFYCLYFIPSSIARIFSYSESNKVQLLLSSQQSLPFTKSSGSYHPIINVFEPKLFHDQLKCQLQLDSVWSCQCSDPPFCFPNLKSTLR